MDHVIASLPVPVGPAAGRPFTPKVSIRNPLLIPATGELMTNGVRLNGRQGAGMNFTFDGEQDQLRALVREFCADHSTDADVRRLMATPEGFDPDVWSVLAGQLGLTGLGIPEQYGGAGYGFTEIGIVLEETGRALLCSPYFSTVVLASTALLASGDEDACQEYLPGIASGQLRATLAFAESHNAGSARAATGSSGVGSPWKVSASPAVTATPAADGWTLAGTKAYVLDGHTADLILVIAGTELGIGLFAVSAGAPGMARTALPTLDQTRKQAEVSFSATPARLIGSAGSALRILEHVLDVAAIGLAVEEIGGAGRCLEMAVEYAKIREQFGRPIGSFQAVKHKCADMLVQLESGRSAAYYGVWAVDGDSDEVPALASLSKAYCSDAFLFCAAENIQVHGGIGFTWEHPAHLYLKRAKSSQLFLGDPAEHREVLAQLIGL
jgi:alkylation response protein AidB-like acyl-CoA dehydrogenase